jgi:energy-coupling factor transporter ATP-binding protein EcfA2
LAESALQVENLWFWYGSPDSPVLRAVDLSVPHSQFVALVGANGSGKTTLVRHLNGLLRPGKGTVLVEGQDTASRTIGELARQVGFLFQHPEQQIFGSSVRQEISFGPQNLGLPSDQVETLVGSALARFDLEDVADQPPAILSYGLRRRVTLASLAAMDPAIVVLDEPTVGLDALGQQETFDWLAELKGEGRTIVLISHDMSLVARYADRVVVLDQGRLIADGSPGNVFSQERVLAQASLVVPPVLALARALEPYGLEPGSLTIKGFVDDYASKVGGP